ncbi:Argininosuccinate lyase [Variovorax sp. PBL-H6]|uniref:tripartite tricarboxylate transporter substrate binding protein n=1 Tax=Variovorax sp. PBL-H6 TaxID=434009 RepID=UPI001315F3C6|nr:tripartite tricarboxylate transporter substrate binding protein [Variovorax sp. PBL-H6]VTU33523.1 Argininosuccinate lyase [Variovorax sp. PBL-H6]
MKRRTVLEAFASSVALLAGAAQSADWPPPLVRIVVGYPPGGPNDLIARAIGSRLASDLQATVIVDNRPGASGMTGGAHVAKSKPDGATLLLDSTTLSIVNALYDKPPIQADTDLAPITLVGRGSLFLVAHPSLEFTGVNDLLRYARSNPGKLAYASTGNGTGPHLAGELFQQMTGVSLVHIPYKGSAPAVTDLLGNQVQLMWATGPAALPHVKAKKLTLLAVTGSERTGDLPDVPTLHESGVSGYEMSIWWGAFGPASLPPDLASRLSKFINAILSAPEVRERFGALGIEAVGTTPSDFQKTLRTDMLKYGEIIRRGQIRPT